MEAVELVRRRCVRIRHCDLIAVSGDTADAPEIAVRAANEIGTRLNGVGPTGGDRCKYQIHLPWLVGVGRNLEREHGCRIRRVKSSDILEKVVLATPERITSGARRGIGGGRGSEVLLPPPIRDPVTDRVRVVELCDLIGRQRAAVDTDVVDGSIEERKKVATGLAPDGQRIGGNGDGATGDLLGRQLSVNVKADQRRATVRGRQMMPGPGGWGNSRESAVGDAGHLKLEGTGIVDPESVLIAGLALLQNAGIVDPPAAGVIDPGGDSDAADRVERGGVGSGGLSGRTVIE